MRAPGKTLLQVVGIILIILGAFGLLGCISSLAMSQSEQMMQVMAMTGVTSEALIMTSIIGTIEGHCLYCRRDFWREELQQTGKVKNQCDFSELL